MSEETRQRAASEGPRDSSSAAKETPSQETLRLYQFGPFRLDPTERKLLRGNEIVALTPKAFDTLHLLVRNSGRVLEKDELIRMLWPDTFVEEGSLSNHIFLLRKALGENPAFIETVPRRGYRFVGAVRQFPRAAPTHREEPPSVGALGIASLPAKARWPWRSRAALGIAAVFLLAALVAGRFYKFAARGGETINSVAVLPFVNASGDPNAEYLSDGITESLINRLTQFRGLRVMARSTVFRFKGKNTDAQEIGHELHVRAVLTGRLLQRGDTLNVQAELVDVDRGFQLWGGRYDRKVEDVLTVQDDIAREISQGLRLPFTGEEEQRLAKNYTIDPEAYRDYLKGRYWWNKGTEEGHSKGVEYFQKAIAKDAGYAQAYSGLADCYSSLADDGVISSKEGYLKAKEAALKALELDDKLAQAHASLALVETSYDWDWPGADREFQRAIELNPSDADAHQSHAEALWEAGRPDEAIAETQFALEFDPLSLGNNADLVVAYFLARRYDQAIEQAQNVLELDPNNVLAYYFRGVSYTKKLMYREAMADFEKAIATAPADELALTGLGYGYAVMGRRTEAQRVLHQLSALSKEKYVSPVFMAKIYAGLQEKDMAFAWLEKAYEDHSIVSVGYIKTNPMLDPLRSDPRFADLLRRTNLQP